MENSLKKELIEILNEYKEKNYGVIIKDMKNDFTIKLGNMGQYPSASLIKLPIIYELYSNPKYNLDEKIKIKLEDKTSGFGIIQHLHNGTELTLRDLALLMIILSDNTATNILIDICTMESINTTAEKLGLNDTVLQRKMMDATARKKGLDNFTSPVDMLKLLEILDTNEEIMSIMKKQLCNNKIPYFFNNDIEFAHKTGDLFQVEHDVGIMFFEDRKIIAIVMTKDFDNRKEVELNNQVGKILYNFIKNKEVEYN